MRKFTGVPMYRTLWFSFLLFFCAWRTRVSVYIAGSNCIPSLTSGSKDEDCAMFVMFHGRRSILTLNYLLLVVLGCLASISNQCVENSECKNGYCRAGMCICNPGWWGSLCQFCRLRWARQYLVHHERAIAVYQLRATWNRSLPEDIVIINLKVIVDPASLYKVVPDIFSCFIFTCMLRGQMVCVTLNLLMTIKLMSLILLNWNINFM